MGRVFGYVLVWYIYHSYLTGKVYISIYNITTLNYGVHVANCKANMFPTSMLVHVILFENAWMPIVLLPAWNKWNKFFSTKVVKLRMVKNNVTKKFMVAQNRNFLVGNLGSNVHFSTKHQAVTWGVVRQHSRFQVCNMAVRGLFCSDEGLTLETSAFESLYGG